MREALTCVHQALANCQERFDYPPFAERRAREVGLEASIVFLPNRALGKPLIRAEMERILGEGNVETGIWAESFGKAN